MFLLMGNLEPKLSVRGACVPRDEPALGTRGGGTGGAAAGGVHSCAFGVGDLSSMAHGAYLRWHLLGFFIAVTVCLMTTKYHLWGCTLK